jgi:hypothetical protein
MTQNHKYFCKKCGREHLPTYRGKPNKTWELHKEHAKTWMDDKSDNWKDHAQEDFETAKRIMYPEKEEPDETFIEVLSKAHNIPVKRLTGVKAGKVVDEPEKTIMREPVSKYIHITSGARKKRALPDDAPKKRNHNISQVSLLKSVVQINKSRIPHHIKFLKCHEGIFKVIRDDKGEVTKLKKLGALRRWLDKRKERRR